MIVYQSMVFFGVRTLRGNDELGKEKLGAGAIEMLCLRLIEEKLGETTEKWASKRRNRLFFIFYFFKDFIYLFMRHRERERERERGRDTGRGRSRLHAGSPGLQDHTLGRREALNC